MLFVLLTACSEKEKVLVTKTIRLENIDQIILLEDSLVRPIHYQNIPDLQRLTINELKEKFVAIVLPSILIARHEISLDRDQIVALSKLKKWNTEDSLFYLNQKQRFKANDIDDLLDRMVTHPNSITLAQAAMESGWGSSRFFKEANNLFGIWSYNKGEPRIPANDSDVFLRKYTDIAESIEDYFVTLGRARAYKKFREMRLKSDNIHELLPLLKNYSQRGTAYTDQLKILIKNSDLERYDHYQIDPDYLIEK